jgi:sulfate permease, SulP family
MTLAKRVRGLAQEVKKFVQDSSLDLLPARAQFRGYSWRHLQRDGAAGLNVALLAIAQGVAFATMAGLPPSYGLTCAAVASLVGPLLASSRYTILGPTNATAFLIFSAMAALPEGHRIEMMPVLIFVAGLVLILGSFLRLADLVQYVSRSVVVGYLAGSALLIAANQMRHLFGLGTTPGADVSTFFGVMADGLRHLGEIQLVPTLISLSTLGLYLGLRRVRPQWPTFALSLVLVSVATVLCLRGGLSVPTLPPFTLSDLRPVLPDLHSPRTWENLRPLWSVALAVAFLSALENSVMAKSLASRSGDRLEVNQEMLSVGVANLACAWFSGMPASGSLTRSALNFASGAVSPAASMISGLLCAAAALTLGPILGWVPRAGLAALVICVAGTVLHRRHLRMCLRATGSDAITLVTTFIATLIMPLHVAIFVGVAVSLMLYLRKAARPQLVEYDFNPQGELAAAPTAEARSHPQISIVHVEGELFFGAAELFRTQIQRLATDPSLRVIILRLKNARHLDATSVMAMEELITFMRSKNRHLLISGALKDVYRVLRNSGLIDILGRDNIFLGSIENPNLSTRNALKRAQALLGTKEADIRIYYDPRHRPAGSA